LDKRLEAVEQAAGLTIPEALLRGSPTGDKLAVLVEMPPERSEGGRIIKPQEVLAREMGGSGWIVALGPEAGHDLLAAAGVESRDQLLGRKVVWGKYAGDALVVTDRDDEFKSRFRIIRDEFVMWVCPATEPIPLQQASPEPSARASRRPAGTDAPTAAPLRQ
jgi:hypothetical protein